MAEADAAMPEGLGAGVGEGRVVVKRVPAECLANGRVRDGVRERLERFQQVAHPDVANLLGVMPEDGGGAVVAWEWVRGEPFDRVAEVIEPDGLYELARDVIRAVDMLHMLGLVHGAIRAGNVIVRQDGSGVCLTDASPLLYTDPEEDVAAVVELLTKTFEARGLPEAAEALRGARRGGLRGLAAALDGAYVPDDPREKYAVPRFKRNTFLWAVVLTLVALAGAAAGWWYWTRPSAGVVESRVDTDGDLSITEPDPARDARRCSCEPRGTGVV